MVKNKYFLQRNHWIMSLAVLMVIAATGMVEGRTGGPDYMGYTFIDSNTSGGPAYNWIDITATGTTNGTLNNSDDHFVDGIPVGFFFNFYGTDYSQLSITNNGILFASGGDPVYSNQPIGSSTKTNFIAPFWDDIVTWNHTGGASGKIYYQTMGISPNRKFVVEWENNQHFSSSPKGLLLKRYCMKVPIISSSSIRMFPSEKLS